MARYRDAGAYTGTSEGTRYVDGVALRSLIRGLCEANAVTISREDDMVTGLGWPGALLQRRYRSVSIEGEDDTLYHRLT